MKKKILLSLLMLFVALSLFADITRDEAEAIAVKDAGVSADAVVRMRSSLDWERGERIYDVEFYADGVEYDYEISTVDGTILSFDQEAERIRHDYSSSMTKDEALSIALDSAGLDMSEISRSRVERDRDDGFEYYEVEFRTQDFSYSYDISGEGEILSYSIKNRNRGRADRNAEPMDRSKAEEIILSYLPSGTEIRSFERDYDDGLYTYEASTYLDGIEYEVKINAVSGDLLSYQEDSFRD